MLFLKAAVWEISPIKSKSSRKSQVIKATHTSWGGPLNSTTLMSSQQTPSYNRGGALNGVWLIPPLITSTSSVKWPRLPQVSLLLTQWESQVEIWPQMQWTKLQQAPWHKLEHRLSLIKLNKTHSLHLQSMPRITSTSAARVTEVWIKPTLIWLL